MKTEVITLRNCPFQKGAVLCTEVTQAHCPPSCLWELAGMGSKGGEVTSVLLQLSKTPTCVRAHSQPRK